MWAPLTEAYEEILGREFPGDPQKRTFAQLIAEAKREPPSKARRKRPARCAIALKEKSRSPSADRRLRQ
jgi:hypothetical protein